MRAAVVVDRDRIEVQEVADPRLGAYDALVEILACGVCTGTDLHILEGKFPWLVPYPFVLGHESIGRVVARGEKVRYLNDGDLVLRPVALRNSEEGGQLGAMWGGYAELGLVADSQAIREDLGSLATAALPQFADAQQVVPSDFDPVDAGMFITFKETLSWFQRLGVVANRAVVILGTGPVGLSFTRIAKYLGAHPVIAVGRRSTRLQAALEMGADEAINTAEVDLVPEIRRLTGGRGADVIVEAIGDAELLQRATFGLADGGEIALYGVPPKLETTIRWAGTAPNWKLSFIKPREEEVHDLALELIRTGFIDLKKFTSHVIPMSDIGEAFRLVKDKQALKLTITVNN